MAATSPLVFGMCACAFCAAAIQGFAGSPQGCCSLVVHARPECRERCRKCAPVRERERERERVGFPAGWLPTPKPSAAQTLDAAQRGVRVTTWTSRPISGAQGRPSCAREFVLVPLQAWTMGICEMGAQAKLSSRSRSYPPSPLPSNQAVGEAAGERWATMRSTRANCLSNSCSDGKRHPRRTGSFITLPQLPSKLGR
ncbi:hypothetical protein B0T26DRAFT_181609 [Lasiosphaeria miniovina]|uniref:Secreted protein n=1 Tax=Lasiosphaeria miniovina TaxID=1954250 RepID=A0AA40B6U5_9PEZI|nr:uncharacterized protein B0T26DRAFT_181609 [Lasiosphaeria miniovina]KAK0728672.1 hypothetical protein B0T26DRAFT_181609 [Lasiosphaeria miniovina]